MAENFDPLGIGSALSDSDPLNIGGALAELDRAEKEARNQRPGFLKEVGRQLLDVPLTHLPASVASAIEGSDIAPRGSITDWLIERGRKKAAEYGAEPGGEDPLLGGLMTREEVRGLGPSLGFSGAGALAGVGAGLPAAAVTSPLGGYAAGGAASYKAASNMAASQFLRDVRDKLSRERGSPLTDAEWAGVAPQYVEMADRYRTAEALPETLSNLAQFAILASPAGRFLPKSLAGVANKNLLTKGATKLAGMTAAELPSEVVTQQLQQPEQVKAGLEEGPERSLTSGADWLQSAKEVAGPVALQILIMGGAGAAGVKAHQALTGRAQPDEITPAPSPPKLAPREKLLHDTAEAVKRREQAEARLSQPTKETQNDEPFQHAAANEKADEADAKENADEADEALQVTPETAQAAPNLGAIAPEVGNAALPEGQPEPQVSATEGQAAAETATNLSAERPISASAEIAPTIVAETPVLPPSETITPKTVGGIPVSDQSDERLRAIAQSPETPATTRHAAVAAIQSRIANPDTSFTGEQTEIVNAKVVPESKGATETPAVAKPRQVEKTSEDLQQGPEVERFQGQYKKGMSERVANQHQKRLSAAKPKLTWTVEKTTIPDFPDRFDVVGRKPLITPAVVKGSIEAPAIAQKPAEAAVAAQPATPAESTGKVEIAAQAPVARAEPAKAPAAEKGKSAKKAGKPTKRPKLKQGDTIKDVREFYTPGNIVYVDYWKQHDRVLDFKDDDGSGHWSVKVQNIEKKGDEWVPTDKPRWHSTMPGKDTIVEKAAPTEAKPVEAEKAPEPAAEKAPIAAEKAPTVAEMSPADLLRAAAAKMDSEAAATPAPESATNRSEATTKPVKVGDEVRIMKVDSIVARTETIGDVRYDLFNGAKMSEDRAAMRVVDMDSGSVVSVKQYPTFDMAEKEYNDTIAKAKKAEQPAPVLEQKEGRIADKNIEDFGQKIEGARKDYAAKLEAAKNADIASVPLSQSWPEPDYAKLLDGGADPWGVAFMHAARDEIPTKPSQSWKLKRWVSLVEQLRDVSLGLADGKYSAARAKELLTANKTLAPVADRLELYQEVGHPKSLKGVRISKGVYSLYNKVEYNPPKVIWSVEMKAAKTAMSHWPKMMATGDTREQAIAAFKKVWLETTPEQDAAKAIDFQLYSGRTEDGKRDIFIGKKIGKNVVTLKAGFENVKDARAWRDAHQADLVSMLEKYKDVPYERKENNSPRVGIDHRNGANVTPERFTETFGFRGVQFGNYVEGDLRQRDLNEAYDALMDLAGVLDIPSKALSLNGELGLAFGARGTGGKRAPSAHYEPVQVVINLTKARGAGSLAHEWFHGADNYFSRMGGKPAGYLSEATTAGEPVRPEMVQAFKQIREAIRKTDLIKRSQRLDQTRSKPYWATGLEMAARSFETYIVAKLQDQNASNDYLANIVSEDYWKAATALGIEKDNTFPYPTTTEMTAIRAAFDHFFQAVETRDTDKGTALFSRSTGENANIQFQPNEANREYTEKLQAQLRSEGYDFTITPAALPVDVADDARGRAGRSRPKNSFTLAERIAGVFGKQVVWITVEGPFKISGVVPASSELSRYVFLDVLAPTPSHVLLGHELTHHMEQDAPDAYRALFQSVSGLLRNHDAYRQLYQIDAATPDADISKEMIGDLMGDHFGNPEFWSLVAKQSQSKTAFQLIANTIRKWINKILPMLGKHGLHSELFVTDLKAARAALAQAVIDYAAIQRSPGNLNAIAPSGFSKGAVADQTQTPEFRAWFGDSKVVDSYHKPLMVYHGTNADVAEFKNVGGMQVTVFGPTKVDRQGFFFTDEQEAADIFASHGEKLSPGANIVPAYLAIRRPLDIRDGISDDMLEEFDSVGLSSRWVKARQSDWELFDGDEGKAFVSALRGLGYDGVRMSERREDNYDWSMEVWVALDPTQIKSAIGNTGAFDPTNPDIRASNAQSTGTADTVTPEMRQRGLALRARITEMLGNRPDVIVKSFMATPESPIGAYSKTPFGSVITMALNAKDELSVADHEGYHAAEDLILSDAERQVVANAMRPGRPLYQRLRQAALTYDRENGTGIADEIKTKPAEARAYGFEFYRRGDLKADGVIGRAWQKLQQFFERVQNAIDGLGFQSAEGVFDALDQGRLAGREQNEQGALEGVFASKGAKTGRSPLSVAISMLAKMDDLFQQKKPVGQTVGDIAAELDPGYQVKPMSQSLALEKKATKGWNITVPNSQYRGGEIYENGKEVWINVSRLLQGSDQGSYVYGIAAAYAHNNGKVLIGDPDGLSRAAYYRRTENMLSSAVKFGTTDHLEPHEGQISPETYYHDQPEFADQARALKWIPSDTVANLRELLYTSYTNTTNLIPELKNVVYNFTKQQYEITDASGTRRFSDADFDRLVAEKRGISATSPVGSATAKRAALVNTFLRGQGKALWPEILAGISAQLSGRGLDQQLRGTFYSRAAVQGGAMQGAVSGSWVAPEAARLDSLIYTLQDKQIDARRVLQAIRATSKQVGDAQDVYLQEELFHGRAAKETQLFVDDELKPLITEMAARGVTMQEFEEYLHARHAEEANIAIAGRNPNMPDGGSGINTKDAQDYLATLDPAKKRSYEALAKRVDAINDATRQLLVDYELESQDTIDIWKAVYKHYVPLHREDMGGGPGIGQGFSVRGPASKMRTGSNRTVVDILANIAMQREKTIVRGEKNVVSTALYGLAKANPNPDFWTLAKPGITTSINAETGQPVDVVDMSYQGRDNVVMSRALDKAGKIVQHGVEFNVHNERALRMALALKNLDTNEMGEILSASAKATRYFASVNTQYNPVFGVVNLTRDSQQAMFNLSTTPIAGKQAEVAKNTLSALKGIYLDLRAERSGQHPSSAWAQLFEEFQTEGGQTGYRDMFRTSKDRAEAIQRELKRVSEGKAKQFGRAVFDWLSDYNSAMENAVRLAAYKVGKESGMTNQRAASMAKNLTVNFNRKGQIGMQAGALYAFFNASVQGTARLAETLNGPLGRKIIVGGITLGAVQALALAAAGFDDDEPPQFIRERSTIIPIGDKKYITIPMPLGLHFIPNIGRIGTEFALSGFKNPGKRVMDLANVFADALNPVGAAGVSLQVIAPTVIDPFAALAENKDWTGKPIYREDMSQLSPTPGHTRAKDTASYFSKTVSKALNYASGGTAYKPGIFSPTPDAIDYLIGQAAGGVGREAMKVEQSISSVFSGEELPTYKIPLVGRFYGDAEQQSSQGNAFYNNLKAINEHEAEIKGRRKAGEPLGDYIKENPEARLVQLANAMERQVSLQRKRKRELIAKDADAEAIKAVDLQITARMKAFNDRVKQVSASAQ